jgi:BolA protein
MLVTLEQNREAILNVYIVSECFNDMSQINRHKLIYSTLSELMKTDIHALSIYAKSPKEL